MREPIVAPDLGWPHLVVSVWYVKPGEEVFAGDRVVELLLGSATFAIAAPCSGKLIEQRAVIGERVSPGQEIGSIDSEPEA
jgi:pyruvate/2-oxoglutarate dehydrogenase complex dihydrolipoamide acyltransferase (E2) component